MKGIGIKLMNDAFISRRHSYFSVDDAGQKLNIFNEIHGVMLGLAPTSPRD